MTNDSIEYTKTFTVYSTLIDGVYFNENDNTVVLDVDDTLYRYSNVSHADVAELVKADSVGAYYNQTFKPTFGPAEKVGYYTDVHYHSVPVKKNSPGTPKGLTEDATNTVNAYVFTTPSTATASSAPTKEFSLNSEPTGVETVTTDDSVRVRVHFTLNGSEDTYKYDATATDVNDAIEELHEYVKRVNARGKVTKVVVRFE